MIAPAQAQLTHHFALSHNGGPVARVAQLGDGGEPCLFMLQTAGSFASDLYATRSDLEDRDRNLFCLTAMRLGGEQLWQVGTPWATPEEPFIHNGGEDMLLVDDLNADGKLEVAVIRHGSLLLLDAATGRELASVALPADNFVGLRSAQLGDPAAGRQILVKVNDRCYPPWDTANPTIVYNADLSVYAEPFAVRGAGCGMVPIDVDGDGRDELLIGYSLLGPDLKERWRLDLGADFDYAHERADRIVLLPPDADGQREIRYAVTDGFVSVSLAGEILRRASSSHSRDAAQGPWGRKGDPRIIAAEKNHGLWGLGPDGRILWNRTDINGLGLRDLRWPRHSPKEGDTERHWCLFRPHLKPMSNPPNISDPALSRGLWPRFMDGDGKLHEALAWDDAYEQPARRLRAGRTDYCGVIYNVLVQDIDGDGWDEILIHDRDHAWLFRAPLDRVIAPA